MKDYRIEVTVKNNLLYKAMIENGFSSAAELAREAKVSNTTIGLALALKLSLYTESGQIRRPWIVLSSFLKRLPEDLVPEKHYFDGLQKNKGHFESDFEEIKMFLSNENNPEEIFFEKETSKVIEQVLNTLTPRQKKVLEMRYGLNDEEEHTFEEIGEFLKVSSVRVMQIVSSAERKLRHPKCKGLLIEQTKDSGKGRLWP